ncbi:MAG: ATP-grasp domain-containing protein [Gemmatimonadetes bacterium]|nr:ATP-grasp domain-containing protein [Gemmatimonadota bacterium]
MNAAQGVLVLDGHTNQALACVRSLGRAGYRVVVASHRPAPLGGWSRFCRARYWLRGETVEAFAALRAWAQQQRLAVVLPLTERSCLLCNADREAWETAGMVVGCAPNDTLRRAFDKAETLMRAQACGIRTPPTRVPATLAAAHAAAEELGFPCVVKPRFSNAWDGAAFLPDRSVSYVRRPDELDPAVVARTQRDWWPLLQGFVPGRGKGVFALCDRGRPVVWFAHERLRDVRPTGSGSSLRRSIPLDPRLQEPAERLLVALRWHGPAMVEFRDDGVDPPCLIEVNGRFWGSLALAVRAGVDFPRLWLALLTGRSLEPVAGFRVGVTLRWLWGDAKHLMAVLAGPPRGYPGLYPTRAQGLKEILGPQPPGTSLETWEPDDYWPGIGEWVQGAVELITRGRAAAARKRPVPVTEHSRHDGHREELREPIRVLAVTSAWPTPGQPRTTHFIKRQVDYLRSAGVHVEVFHFRGRRRPWRYLAAWARLQRRLRIGRYDLIHAQFGQSGLLALPKRLPLVVTFRGSDLLGIVGDAAGRHIWAGKVLQRVSRMVARRADAVIVVSEHMKNSLPPDVPASVLPSGIDLDLFRPMPRDAARRRLGLPLGASLVLFAGRPDQARKRFELAKQAVELLRGSLPAELIVAWGAQHTDMPLYMNACDALVFTSMQEGSPNVVKEALACDLPVVSVPVGDVADRLRGVEGCEVCGESPPAIAAALERVLRRGRRVAGHEAVKDLDEAQLTARLIRIYRTILRRPEQESAAGATAEPARELIDVSP